MAPRSSQPGTRTAPSPRPLPSRGASRSASNEPSGDPSRAPRDPHEPRDQSRAPRDPHEPRPRFAYADDPAESRLGRRRAAQRRMRQRRRRSAVLSLLLAATVLVTVDLVRDRPETMPSLATAGSGPLTSGPSGARPGSSGARPESADTGSADTGSGTTPQAVPPSSASPSPSPGVSATGAPATAAPGGPAPSAVPSTSASGPTATVPVRPPADGNGQFAYAAAAGRVLGAAGTVRRFHVAVEEGMGLAPAEFAAAADRVLGDSRSWVAGRQLRLQRVPRSTSAEFTLYLASAGTSERMCARGGLDTDRYTSCRLPGEVIINADRWFLSVDDYGAPLSVYQDYVINHEVGHQLGHGHEGCTGDGRPAPVMQQQTLTLDGCVANSWPYLNGKRYAGPAVP